jgi:hypothetical protein
MLGRIVSLSTFLLLGSFTFNFVTLLSLSLLQRQRLTKNSTRLVIALVGLPARGKSFVSRKVLHYLNWTGCKCRIFNVGKYRREAYAVFQQQEQQQQQSQQQPAGGGDPPDSTSRAQKGSCDANFFDANNEQASRLREMVAEVALQDMLKWCVSPPQCWLKFPVGVPESGAFVAPPPASIVYRWLLRVDSSLSLLRSNAPHQARRGRL